MTRDEVVQELSGIVYTRPLDALKAAYAAGAARLAEVEAENERLRGTLVGTRKHVSFAHQHGYVDDEIAGGILADIDAALSLVKP